jgi:hypothetical protein
VLRLSCPAHPACITSILAVLALLTPGALAAQQGIQPLPPDEKAFGLTLGEWLAAEQEWLYSIPQSTNPTPTTANGMYDGVGQRMPVWFLPTPRAPMDLTRTIVIPAGYAILWVGGSAIAYDTTGSSTEEELRSQLQQLGQGFLDKVSLLELSVDGGPTLDIKGYRVQTPLFNLVLPPNNLLGIPVAAGQDQRQAAVADCFAFLLPALPSGKYVLLTHGRGPNPANSSQTADVYRTYNLMVKDPNDPIW